jgi:hypothetical protein
MVDSPFGIHPNYLTASSRGPSHNHTYSVFDRLISDFEDYLNETYFETDFMEHYAPPIDTAIFE